jgi:DNA-binding GntR family transcriptional regulator
LIGTLDTEHHEILAACEAQDPARAVRAIRNHLGQTVAHVTDDLEHAKPDSAQPVT